MLPRALWPLALAGLVFARAAPAQPTESTESTPEAAEAARRLFREGARLASTGHWEEARDRFRRALAVRPSPLLHFNLAVAAQNSGHLVEAIDQYRQFLRDDTDPANALRRHEAQTAIGAIEPVLARVTLTVQGGEPTQVRLDGRLLPLALLGVEVPVDPGEHVFEAEGPEGLEARQSLLLGDGEQRALTLTLRAPPVAPAPPAEGTAPSPTPPPPPPLPPRETAAPLGTIARVRRAIEEQAAAADASGERRWQRTLVLYPFLGIGSPAGLVGVGLRWAARPWFEVELDTGVGHPFGLGVQPAISARIPWSYQYATGLMLGFALNFTGLEQGSAPSDDPERRCLAGSPFTPMWLLAGITNEWRVAPSFTVRVSAGARTLLNRGELRDALEAHCLPQPASLRLLDYFFDAPEHHHTRLPVLPWVMVDLGWVPSI